MKQKKINLIIFLTLLLIPAAAESFRVRKLIPVHIPGDSSTEQTITTGINDSIAVFLPDETEYLEGIELKMSIPQSVAEWRDSVACSIYDKITPVPSSAQIDYSGTRIYVTTVPTKLSWIMQIPLKEKNSLKGSQYITKADVIPDTSKQFTFIRFQPAMKGIPEETVSAKINIAIKPVLINKGKLRLSVKTPDGHPALHTTFIDGTPMAEAEREFLLNAGLHNLSIQSEEYRSEVRSFYIDQAKNTDISIDLKSLEPTLRITAPDNTEIYIDGKPFVSNGKEVVIPEGEHRIRFLMGDYEVVKVLNIQKGKSYNANLSVDLQITEE